MTHPLLFGAMAAVLGLIAGSFVNVVIWRLPRMLKTPPVGTEHFNLAWPGSLCPHCQTPVRTRHNIPVISFILLRGRCHACRDRISLQYPAVELAAAFMAVACAWHFGPDIAICGLAMLLSWALLALAVIDWHTQLLPDSITLPLLWLGLLINTTSMFATPEDAIIGAACGYLVLWAVYQLFRLLTGRQGMGYGDFKLLAALGAWLGWQQLPVILLLSSIVGTGFGLLLLTTGRLQAGRAFAFGPFLAAAGWLSLIAGDTMLQNYLLLAGTR